MPPAKKKTNKAYQKADVISRGTEITDNIKRCRFRILKELGSGGFGRIYDGIQIKVYFITDATGLGKIRHYSSLYHHRPVA